jgi:hypothetical protein
VLHKQVSMRTYRRPAQDGPRDARFVALGCYHISSTSRQVVIESSNLDNERSPIIAGTHGCAVGPLPPEEGGMNVTSIIDARLVSNFCVSSVFYSSGLHSLVLARTTKSTAAHPPCPLPGLIWLSFLSLHLDCALSVTAPEWRMGVKSHASVCSRSWRATETPGPSWPRRPHKKKKSQCPQPEARSLLAALFTGNDQQFHIRAVCRQRTVVARPLLAHDSLRTAASAPSWWWWWWWWQAVAGCQGAPRTTLD